MDRSSTAIGSGLAILLGLTAGTGAYLASTPEMANLRTDTGSVYILGPARSLLSAGLYERADLYFHKGTPHKREEAFESLFQKWKKQISPTQHAHAEGRELEEIMPWLRLATKSDPHNIEAYLVASYWLNEGTGNPDAALAVMDEALGKNPDRYELYQEKGRLFLGIDRLNEAASAFQTALTLIIEPDQPDPEQAAIDLSFLLTVQSFLYEVLGRPQEAIQATAAFRSIHPDNESFAARLEDLRAGKLDGEAAKARLAVLCAKKSVHEDDDHGDDHDHNHDHDHDHENPASTD